MTRGRPRYPVDDLATPWTTSLPRPGAPLALARRAAPRIQPPLEQPPEGGEVAEQAADRGDVVDGAQGLERELLHDDALAHFLAFADARERVRGVEAERGRDG